MRGFNLLKLWLFVSHNTNTFPPPLLVFALSVVMNLYFRGTIEETRRNTQGNWYKRTSGLWRLNLFGKKKVKKSFKVLSTGFQYLVRGWAKSTNKDTTRTRWWHNRTLWWSRLPWLHRGYRVCEVGVNVNRHVPNTVPSDHHLYGRGRDGKKDPITETR